jgi:hypothetical protein
MSADNCLVATHDKPTLAVYGLRLCFGHVRHLGHNLDALPALHAQLAGHLVRTGSGGEVVAVSRTPGINLDLVAYAAREHIVMDLHSWTRIALEEGPWDHAPDDTVVAMATWLHHRVSWLAARDYADEIARDFATTMAEAHGAIQPDRVRRVELNYGCPERTIAEDGLDMGACTGMLFALIRDLDAILPSSVQCSTERSHVWQADEWRALGRRAEHAGYAALARRVTGGVA